MFRVAGCCRWLGACFWLWLGCLCACFWGVHCVTQGWVCLFFIPVGEGLSLLPCQRVMHLSAKSYCGEL